PQAGGLPAGNCGRAALNRALERKPDARRAVTDLVDDEELAVRTIPEVLLQDRASTLGVGSRDGERVREPVRQLLRGVDAGEQSAQPEAEDRRAETQDEPGPAGHESRLDSPGTVRPWRSEASWSTPPNRGASTTRRTTSSAATTPVGFVNLITPPSCIRG